MSNRIVVSIAAAAILGIALVSTDAMARGGGRGGFHGGARAGGFHGGARAAGIRGGARVGGGYRGGYAGRGIGVGVGAAAVGAAAVAPRYYNSVGCGIYPNPPC